MFPICTKIICPRTNPPINQRPCTVIGLLNQAPEISLDALDNQDPLFSRGRRPPFCNRA